MKGISTGRARGGPIRRIPRMLFASVLTFGASASAIGQPAESDRFVIVDVRVFDGRKTHERRSVAITEGRIVTVGDANLDPQGAEIIDGEGRTLLPGLIDSHVHLPAAPEQELSQAASLGVTTVIDMFNPSETLSPVTQLRDEDRAGLADFRTAGLGVTAPGGHPSQMTEGGFPTVASPGEADSFVRERLSQGSDFIKIIYDDLGRYGDAVPMISKDALEAVIEAADARDVSTVVHIDTEAQARTAIAAGASGLAHLFTGEEVSTDFGAFAAQHGSFVIPTLSVLQITCGHYRGARLVADDRLGPFLSPQAKRLAALEMGGEMSCAALQPTLRQLIDADVPILAGTDSPIPGTALGASLHGELAALVQLGMTPVQALVAATSAPAEAFDLDDRGRIEAGMRADLVLVEGDPTQDIRATRNIVAVWKRGQAVQRQRYD